MATLTMLLDNEVLNEILVPLYPRESVQRRIYGFPEVTEWMMNVLPGLVTGRMRDTEAPSAQMDTILRKWISGKPIRYRSMFKDMEPYPDQVWELKTNDIRIFGWMYRPKEFIAVFPDYADDYKEPTRTKSYFDAARKVVRARDNLDLHEPKIAMGTFDDLVSI